MLGYSWFPDVLGPNCQGIYCGDGKHCDSEHQPEPKCVCNNGCPKTYDPICGSNNKTYDNSCELQQDACLTNSSISVRFKRRCDEGKSIKVTLNCKLKDSQIISALISRKDSIRNYDVLLKKERIWDIVCISWLSYRWVSVSVVFLEGPGCSDIDCPRGRTCVVDERNRPICVCSQYCHSGSKEDVCGSDNKTYSSECFLTVAACMTNKSITVQSYGQCRSGQ